MLSRKIPSNEVKINVKLGIIKTIAKSIYSGPLLKIREAVSNSIDNKATNFVIYIDRASRSISLLDNGNGINYDRFLEIFDNIGYGISRGHKDINSYFGLGLLSIFQLGTKVKVFSKSGTENYSLIVDTAKLFNEKNEKENISFIKNCIELRKSNIHEREINSIIKNNSILNNINIDINSNYTEIVINGVDKEIIDEITTEEFIAELSKILPLKPDKNAQFFAAINDKNFNKWLDDVYDDREYCPTIKVFYGVEDEIVLKQIMKYLPTFKHTYKFNEQNILYGKNKEFAYYVLYISKDMETTGLWVRNHNFLVKESDYLQQPGSKKKIISEPLQNWMFGEIFHKDMNDFLVVTRNDYIWSADEFKAFKKKIEEILYDLNTTLRAAWKTGNEIRKIIIDPIINIDQNEGPFNRLKAVLTQLDIDIDDEKSKALFLNKMESKDKSVKDNLSVDKLIYKLYSDKIVLSSTDEAIICINKDITEEQIYTQDYDDKQKKVLINISPSIFSPKEVDLFGEAYQAVFIYGDNDEPGININTHTKKIYINIFNTDLLKYSVSFVDLYIAIEMADILSKTKTEMKHFIFKILGAKYPKVDTYFTPLFEDIKRMKRG